MHRVHKHIIVGFSGIIVGGIITTMLIVLIYGPESRASIDPEVPVILDPTLPAINDPSDHTVTSIEEINEQDATSSIPSMVSSPSLVTSPDELIDSDHDGLSDATEQQLGTDPHNSDSDGDGYKDGEEVDHGYSPLSPKADRSLATRGVEVNLDRQELYYFMNKVKVRTFPVSTGLPDTPTPIGQFKIGIKIPLARYVGRDYDLPDVKWNLQFKPRYFIHGTYWHNKFGIQAMSHGCVNMSEDDAERVYTFLQKGDGVKIFGKTPLGKVEK